MRPLMFLHLLTCGAMAGDLPDDEPFTNSIGMEFVRIAPGEFTMGNGDRPPASEEEWKARDWDESPAQKVKVTRACFMGAYEVTNAQYEQFDPEHKDQRGKFRVSIEDNEPVTMVSWQEAVDFCDWLSKKEGRRYRLPTEAEWEFACRAGTETAFHTGDSLTAEHANIAGDKRNRTRPVGSYKPNPWGLFDMHGNVEEWCLDWYGPYQGDDRSDPLGAADGYAKVSRGGSYQPASWQDDNARYARSANRSGYLPQDKNRCVGFRVVCGDLPPGSTHDVQPPALHARDVLQKPAPADAPVGDGPWFDDFKDRRATIPQETWGPIFSKWNHYTACCVCPNGDILACWYTTKSESGRELAQAASRLVAGSDRWQPVSLFFDVPDVNDHAPVLIHHGDTIYHFASQSISGWDETTNIMRISTDSGATWSKPRIIARREGPHNLSQACSGFVRDNNIYLAVDGSGHRTESLLIGKNLGDHWSIAEGDLRKAMDDEYAIHPAIAPCSDGALVAFMRGPDPMPRLISEDNGTSWSAENTPFGGINVGQKAAVIRLNSGALLLCASDARKPPITGRRGTFAAISDDDGETWSHIRPVDGVGGYMSAAQAPNGIIYLVGSRMAAVAFNEAWVREGPEVK